jgi:serine protease Do
MTNDKLGPRVSFVVPGSGAARAGLLVGDVITRVNGKRLKDSDEMVTITSNLLPGDKLRLSILREEKEVMITAAVGSVADTLTSPRARFQARLGGRLSQRRFLFPSVLEHDCALAPNQCGGVLVNVDGQAIGVNIARASRISSYAIPASVARPILESLQSRAIEGSTIPVASPLSGTQATEMVGTP